jgi:hypothetical protein
MMRNSEDETGMYCTYNAEGYINIVQATTAFYRERPAEPLPQITTSTDSGSGAIVCIVFWVVIQVNYVRRVVQ